MRELTIIGNDWGQMLKVQFDANPAYCVFFFLWACYDSWWFSMYFGCSACGL